MVKDKYGHDETYNTGVSKDLFISKGFTSQKVTVTIEKDRDFFCELASVASMRNVGIVNTITNWIDLHEI